MPTVFTIGHSNHALKAFLALLRLHRISAVGDVRSTPYSRFNPQFNREPLGDSLRVADFRYVYLGRELGGRRNDPGLFRDGRISYERVARTERFRRGLARVVRGAANHRIALMCAEKEPTGCHRGLLVAPALEERGVAVAHILADGRLERHEAAMERLLERHGSPPDLFLPRRERIAWAVGRETSGAS